VSERIDRFEAAMLPYLDTAYNLARWLLRDGRKAEDAVQDAYLKALLYFDGFRDGDAKPWLLRIVRNCCFTLIDADRKRGTQVEFVEDWDSAVESLHQDAKANGPEQMLMHKQDIERIDQAIEELPVLFREAIVLREIEELSYEQMAQLMDVPVGTVMSRLARARAALRAKLAPATRRAG
jgi:RNA polymerase sigma-70 factor (ECF subfamily)